MERRKQFVKGFIIDQGLVARAAGIDYNDPEVHNDIFTITRGLNRDGFKFLGVVYQHSQSGKQPDENDLALAIVFEIGDDEEALRRMELPPLDDTIVAAQPHVLIGPGVWEFWG
jgi:hypothetical protein